MGPLYLGDVTFLLLIPAFLLAMYAQMKVQGTYNKYAKVPAQSGYTGAQMARALLDANQLNNVAIEITNGRLSDHYDPGKKVLRLSPEVYHGKSLAALGIAAHEIGHAAQHANSYVPLAVRNSLVPIANIGGNLAFPLFFIGLFIQSGWLVDLGVILFAAAVAFQLITLPVEFNASNRAMAMLEGHGYLSRGEELQGARKVLSAAALTYIAATAVALLQLVRLLLLRGRRND
jgi:Zn-dependent membrane protease YugP